VNNKRAGDSVARWLRQLVLAGVLSASLIAVPGFGTAAHAGEWRDVDNACHNGGVSGETEYLWCWDKKKRVLDSTPDYDVFAFHMSLSGEAVDGWLNRLWVEMEPRDTSPTQSWYSTNPKRPNQTYTTDTGCTNWSWELGAGSGIAAAYGESGTICSDRIEYEPVNRSAAGHHAGELWKSNCWASGTTKRVTAAVLVRVAPGKVPTWSAAKHGMHQRRIQATCEAY
jgi:hypothetical protein